MGGDQLQNILQRLGDFGPYQKFQHSLHLLSWLAAGVHFMSFVFVFPMLEHRCFLEEIDDGKSLENISTAALNLSSYIPANESSCSMYENGLNSSQISCPNGYIYSSDFFKSSRVTEWDMVCEREWMRALLQSLFLFGALVGAFLSGLFADKFGRKIVLCTCGAAQLLFGLAGTFMGNYVGMTILMFGYGLFGAAGSVVPAITLTMEIVGPSRRPLCGILFSSTLSLGFILACLWAWLLPQSAVLLQLIFALHSLLIFPHWWFMDESICWLWAGGRKEEAWKIARKAASWNGVSLDENDLELEMKTQSSSSSSPQVLDDGEAVSSAADIKVNVKSHGILDLFRFPEIRKRSMVMMYTWFTSSMIYFGLTYNSVTLSGNPYLAFVLNICVEIPGNLLVVLLAPKIGNKIVICSAFFLSGIGCILLPLLPKDLMLLTNILTMITKGIATISFNIVNGYTAELFPTVVRNTALGICLMASRAGAAIVPEINLLGKAASQMPSMSFGTFGLLAGLFVMFMMPETMNKSIPQSIEEVEKNKQVEEPTMDKKQKQEIKFGDGLSNVELN